MKVPQIVTKTGVSADYWNEYFPKTLNLKRGLSYVAENFKKYPVKNMKKDFLLKSMKM